MNSATFAPIAMLFMALTSACSGGGKFSGSSKSDKAKVQPAQVESDEDAQKLQGGAGGDAKDEGDSSSKAAREQQAIAKCLAAWGTHPFGDKPKYREIYASVSVLGNGRSAVVDDVCTKEPELVLVGATVSLLGSTKYELKNPNGWYCIMADVNLLTKTIVELEKRAHLADNKVDVNVLGSGHTTSAINVNVMSDVQVQRVDSSCN